MSFTPMDLMKRKRAIRFGLVMFFLIGILAEGGLRLFFGNNHLGRLLNVDDHAPLCLTLKPKSTVTHTGILRRIPAVLHSVNAYGYRGDPRPPTKPVPVFRIVVVGDSFTFCPGVAEGRDYPAQLERVLSQSMDRPVQVLNFGVPSYNLEQVEAAFRERALRFEPDLVILQIAQNDFAVSVCEMFRLLGPFHQLIHYSYLARYAFAMVIISTQDYETPNDERLAGMNRFAKNVGDMAKRKQIGLLITSFDEPVDCDGGGPCLAPVFAKRHIPYFPFPENVRTYLTLDMGHLNEEGCLRYARALGEKILRSLRPLYAW